MAATGAPSYREQGVRTYRDVSSSKPAALGDRWRRHSSGRRLRASTARDYVAKSAIARQHLSSAAITTLVDGIAALAGRTGVGNGTILLDSLGGAVARVAPSATAFPHRDAFAVAQLIGSWDAAAPAAVGDATQAWLRDLYTTARPLIGRGAYVNYADADLTDGRTYYGENLARLRQVKAKYTRSIFDFPQAVRP